MTHELKCWPEQFEAVVHGRKRFEWRFDDRGFKPLDRLLLREFDPSVEAPASPYTGRELLVRVTYLLRGPAFGIPLHYVVMSIVPETTEGS
jgi:hypothetical protein